MLLAKEGLEADSDALQQSRDLTHRGETTVRCTISVVFFYPVQKCG